METVTRCASGCRCSVDPPSDDICYATQNRQHAVKEIGARVRRGHRGRLAQLVELGAARRGGLDAGAGAAYLVDYADEIDEAWLDGVTTVGVTAGRRVPEVLVDGCWRGWPSAASTTSRSVEAAQERLLFALPQELRRDLQGRRGAACGGAAPGGRCAAASGEVTVSRRQRGATQTRRGHRRPGSRVLWTRTAANAGRDECPPAAATLDARGRRREGARRRRRHCGWTGRPRRTRERARRQHARRGHRAAAPAAGCQREPARTAPARRCWAAARLPAAPGGRCCATGTVETRRPSPDAECGAGRAARARPHASRSARASRSALSSTGARSNRLSWSRPSKLTATSGEARLHRGRRTRSRRRHLEHWARRALGSTSPSEPKCWFYSPSSSSAAGGECRP